VVLALPYLVFELVSPSIFYVSCSISLLISPLKTSSAIGPLLNYDMYFSAIRSPVEILKHRLKKKVILHLVACHIHIYNYFVI
jgi:hypothetical protein